MSDTPEEDKYLCKHEWVDLYEGSGVSAKDPYVALNAFFCKWCLDIRVKSYSQHRYAISKELLEDFRDNSVEGDAMV